MLKPDFRSWWISKMQSGREDTLEERYAKKLCFKLGKNATETYGMLQTAFRASCMNRASVFKWHKRFKEGRESVRDDERCGRSNEVNTTELIGHCVITPGWRLIKAGYRTCFHTLYDEKKICCDVISLNRYVISWSSHVTLAFIMFLFNSHQTYDMT